MQKRKEIPRLIKTWLGNNKHGKLTSDQWLNLVTEPIATLLIFLVPLIVVLTLSPARMMLRFARYGRFVIPAFLIAAVIMLMLRARHFARQPLYHAVLYGDDHAILKRWFTRFQPRLTVYSESGEPVRFHQFVTSPPYLEPDTAYIMYYLEAADQRRTLLSYAPLDHPDAEKWQPSDKFYQRQKQRQQI